MKNIKRADQNLMHALVYHVYLSEIICKCKARGITMTTELRSLMILMRIVEHSDTSLRREVVSVVVGGVLGGARV